MSAFFRANNIVKESPIVKLKNCRYLDLLAHPNPYDLMTKMMRWRINIMVMKVQIPFVKLTTGVVTKMDGTKVKSNRNQFFLVCGTVDH